MGPKVPGDPRESYRQQGISGSQPIAADMTEKRDFTPALGDSRLTPFYDLAIRLLTREQVWRDALIEQIDPSPADRILDVGCGTGSLAIQLKAAEPAAKVIGLDPDSEVLERARRKADWAGVHIEWLHGFLTEETVGEIAPATKVVSSLLFHQTPLDEKANLLSLTYKILQPAGTLCIADYGFQKSILMRTLFRHTVQTIDGIEDTQPNADGILPSLITSVGFTDLREIKIIPTATGAISIYTAKRTTS